MRKKRLLFHAPMALWAVFILTLTSIPNMRVPDTGLSFQDLLAHAFVYAILGYLICRSLEKEGVSLSRAVPAAAVLSIIFGGFDELHQLLIPGREASWLDWAADSFGAAAGAVWRGFIVRRGQRK